ncbi:MAG: Mur ligase family protein [Candidatus Omnitrophica bacterium]|jgi:UDP-N-acetylmuramoylalanine--D-glutamate ligase|nr:Mur ligase family protein [Candidatus Omnitrophota bacterium]MDD5078788.1 Mur ligase family protein [Candidatus Omnitrophota bacterium]
MRNTGYFKDKKITVVGLARSGLACANLLYDLGAQVSVTDSRRDFQTQKNARLLRSAKIKRELGAHTQEFIAGRDIIVISPGVPDTALPVVWSQQRGIPMISEIEVGWILCPAPVIAVTGSSGKTTVTTLIGLILKAAGKRPFVCGNIGNPFTGELKKIRPCDYVVLEISSFQLEKVQSFKPRISLITNVSKNHLDRYKGMREYIRAKKRIFLNQDISDHLVLNSRDKELRKVAGQSRAKVVFFKDQRGLNPNQSAVLAVGTLLGINKKVCLKVFKEFKGLQHRMEEVAVIKGVRFVNDSKATTVESAIWALNNIASKAILIAGGKDKGVDYRALLAAARKKVKEAVLIGEACEKIKSALKGSIKTSEARTLEEAVERAFAKASSGDCVLLSPMCSSYDMFCDYEHRGRAFKEAVFKLAKAGVNDAA